AVPGKGRNRWRPAATPATPPPPRAATEPARRSPASGRSSLTERSPLRVELAAAGTEGLAPLAQAGLAGALGVDTALRRVVADLLRDLHAAEARPAHRAEVGRLVRVGGQRRVVQAPRRVGIEREVDLVLPAELEARLREGVVAPLRARMPLGEVGGVRRDLVGDHALLDVLAVRQPEVLARRHVAEHRRAVPADHRGADRGG